VQEFLQKIQNKLIISQGRLPYDMNLKLVFQTFRDILPIFLSVIRVKENDMKKQTFLIFDHPDGYRYMEVGKKMGNDVRANNGSKPIVLRRDKKEQLKYL